MFWYWKIYWLKHLKLLLSVKKVVMIPFFSSRTEELAGPKHKTKFYANFTRFAGFCLTIGHQHTYITDGSCSRYCKATRWTNGGLKTLECSKVSNTFHFPKESKIIFKNVSVCEEFLLFFKTFGMFLEILNLKNDSIFYLQVAPLGGRRPWTPLLKGCLMTCFHPTRKTMKAGDVRSANR